MISLEKWMILAPLQKMPKNVGDLGKSIVAKGFKKLPKVQKKSPTLVTLESINRERQIKMKEEDVTRIIIQVLTTLYI